MIIDADAIQTVRSLPEALRLQSKHAARPAQWYRHDGEYRPVTYAQLIAQVDRLATGLIRHGIRPGDRVAILMENRPEWAVVDYAILSIGAVTVPLYCSYRAQDIAYVLKDAGAVAAFVSGGQLLRHLSSAAGECPEVAAIFSVDEPGDGDRIRSWSELAQDEPDIKALEERMAAIGADALATLVYTSGTTANPKGVMLSHGNILANLRAIPYALELSLEDRMLSFLPLAHSLERTAGHFLIYSFGMSVAFAERADTVGKNMAEARPTILISVPRMLEVVQGRILAQVAKQPAFRRRLFHAFLGLSEQRRQGRLGLLRGVAYLLLDRMVGEKIRSRFGGRLRVMVSGGAPLNVEVSAFFEQLGIPVLQGYGLTESAPLLNVNPMHDRRHGTVGKAVRGVEIRIAEDGEILARGANIMQGYWHLPEATGEALDDERWLHTGDVGELDADGYLKITDRKKDLIVNSGGENISPQRIEALLATDSLIDQVVVFGDKKPYLVALIVPSREASGEWARQEGLPETDWDHLYGAGVLRKELQARVNRLLAPLNSFEQVRRIHVLPEPLSVEDGLLTPTLKVKRRQVFERFAEALERLYA